MDRLAGRFRTLAVDLYGSGKSPDWPADRPLTLADEVALLEPIFGSVGDRFHLIGHSYGGAVALKAALAGPGRLRSLVLFEPVLFALLNADDPAQPAAREITAVRDDTIAAVDRGDLDTAGARFVDYWTGAGAWASMPDERRRPVATRDAEGEEPVARGVRGAGSAVGLRGARRAHLVSRRLGFPCVVASGRPSAREDLASRDRSRDRGRGAHGAGHSSGPDQRADRGHLEQLTSGA